MPNENYVGTLIKKARAKKKMSRFDLAVEMEKHGKKTTTETIRNWEKLNSSPDPETLNVIAAILETPIEKFFKVVS